MHARLAGLAFTTLCLKATGRYGPSCGAMSMRGIIATMTVEQATDADIFLAYLEQALENL